MKEKETDVSQLLSKLSLKNNLDQEDEEDEVVESLVVVEQNEENADQFNYTSKAPVRNNQSYQARSNPYHVPKQNVLADPNLGRFIDDETEIEFIQSRVKKSSNAAAPAKDFDSENGIPNLPKIERKSSFTPVILIQNTNADYQILDLGLTIILDKNLQNVGIWIPETVLDEDIKVENGRADIYIQLRGPKHIRMVNYIASIEKDETSRKLMFKKQFVHLAPLFGINDLTCDVNPDEIQKAIAFVNAKNLTDLLKSYGPNEESLLMTFCCQKNDSAVLRAQIFAFLSRVLLESNQDAIEMIIKKNQVGLSALDYATMANNAKVAAFLAKLFYIFGQDVHGKDTQGNTILHMIARKGDMVAPTLGALMSLSYRNHNGNKKVYPTDVKNSKHEMPIHIVSMNKKCAQHIIQLLVKDCPAGLKSPTLDGSLPIHLACQYSSDPTLLASLLYYDKSVVNMQRADGFTPLHLVAARANVHDVHLGLIRLGEDTQVRMIKILLEHGADKKATVEDLYHPVDLLSHDRSKAKDFLKLSQFERKHCSSSGSSDNESPTPPSSAFNHLDESSNYSTITPSPEGFPMYSDPCMNLGHSPAATSSSSTESPAPNTYNIGSVSSNYTGSDPDSDSDNCNPQKMGASSAEVPSSGVQNNEVLAEDQDFDFIAKVLYNHPAIQAVMANNL